MRIIDKIKADGVHISFEVFPPKTDAGFESVLKATDGIAELTPSFISVTYGACLLYTSKGKTFIKTKSQINKHP